MSRKPSGEGTYWKEGKTWCWKRRVGPRGQQRTFSVQEDDYTTFRTRVEEEQQKIKRMGKQAAQQAPKGQTIDPLLPEWLEAFLKPPHKSRSTYRSYKNAWVRRLKPRFGKKKVAQLTDVDIQSWLNDQDPTRSLEIALILLNKFLVYCQSKGYIHSNPAENLAAPEYGAKEGCALDPEQMRALIEEAHSPITMGQGAKHKPTRNRHLFRFLLSAGTRINEALGLKITEIDWKEGTANITKQLQYDGETGEWSREELKTKNAKRTLVLETEAVKALRHQLAMVNRERKRAGEGYEENMYLFPTEAGTPQFARNITRTLEKIIERAKVPVTESNVYTLPVEGAQPKFERLPKIGLHHLRTTCLTNLANRGMPMHQLQKYAGHASITTTAKYYLKVGLDAQRAAIENLKPLGSTTTKTVAPKPREEKKA